MQHSDALHSTVEWVVKEFRRKGSLLLKEEVLRRRNLQTNYGLTAYASAFQGSYAGGPPIYFVIDAFQAVIQNVGGIGVGATSVTLDKVVEIAGDTSIILGMGTANQETVTFSGRSGSSPNYVYTISATTKSHAQNDPCVRPVLATDTMTSVQLETQYDAINAASQRLASLGGYSQGQSNWTMQFFFSGTQASNVPFNNCGLADSITVGAGNLHNHLLLAYTHAPGVDVEIDVSLTLS